MRTLITESDMQTQELERIESVTVTQSGEQFTSDQALLETYRVTSDLLMKEVNRLLDLANSLKVRATNAQNEVDRLNNVLLQESVNKTKDTQVKNILLGHLGKMLNEHEGIWDLDKEFESIEFALDYIEAAKAAKFLGRKSDKIDEVQAWIDRQQIIQLQKHAS